MDFACKYQLAPLPSCVYQVPTKITKGQIEITTAMFLVPKGQKVCGTEFMGWGWADFDIHPDNFICTLVDL